MRKSNSQIGFSVVELVIVLAVAGALGLVGYSVYSRQSSKTPNSSASVSQPTTAADIPTAPQVNSTSDLDRAAAILDQTDTSSGNDSAQLDSQLQSF